MRTWSGARIISRFENRASPRSRISTFSRPSVGGGSAAVCSTRLSNSSPSGRRWWGSASGCTWITVRRSACTCGAATSPMGAGSATAVAPSSAARPSLPTMTWCCVSRSGYAVEPLRNEKLASQKLANIPTSRKAQHLAAEETMRTFTVFILTGCVLGIANERLAAQERLTPTDTAEIVAHPKCWRQGAPHPDPTPVPASTVQERFIGTVIQVLRNERTTGRRVMIDDAFTGRVREVTLTFFQFETGGPENLSYCVPITDVARWAEPELTNQYLHL